LVASLAALGLTTAAEASNGPVVIGFEKDCPELTCEETAGSPVQVSTVVTPLAFAGGIFHYSATETLSSASGSVTVSLAGILNMNTDPDFTVLHGTVASGSWNGVNLTGAQVHASAIRVAGTTFAGSVAIMPGSAD
jgi:hypothetical protein